MSGTQDEKGEPMDKEQAIEKLNDIRCHVKETSTEEQALVMAINALKAQLSQEGTTSDTISRQAALDIFDDYNISVENGELEAYSRDRKRLCELPKIQPEERTKERTETHAYDLISRQAARHALCKAVHKDEDIPCDNQTESCLWTGTRVCDYVREIDALPSVQPEPKEGEWTLGFDNIYMEKYYYCSRCGCRKYGEHEPLDYFCSNCGAKMKGAQNG